MLLLIVSRNQWFRWDDFVVNCNMRVGIKFHIAYNLLSYEYLIQFFTRRDQSGGTRQAAELRVRQCIKRNNWTLFFLKTEVL